MKIKVSKHKLNIHYRGSPWGSRTQQHAYCLRYAHSQHTESHLGKKQPQAKIPRAFLFSQLHFNNVTSHALFYGGHLVMRGKRCAVQNQGITLSNCISWGIIWNIYTSVSCYLFFLFLGKLLCVERQLIRWPAVTKGLLDLLDQQSGPLFPCLP